MTAKIPNLWIKLTYHMGETASELALVATVFLDSNFHRHLERYLPVADIATAEAGTAPAEMPPADSVEG